MTDPILSGIMPAVLGGDPIFSVGIPISQPTLPAFEMVESRFRDIFSTGMITTSKYVEEFERTIAAYIGVEDAVAVSSNTMGLLLLFKCLDLRGEVILPSFTFTASGHALAWNNLKPVYADINLETCVVDPDVIEGAITSETCAIFGVHLWGNPCAAETLQDIADRHEVPLLFDAAQAIGSTYQGRQVGSYGLAEVFSCSPTKMMTAAEGGIITTNDTALAAKIRLGRNYGVDAAYDCDLLGVNARLSELHAVLGLASLQKLEGDIKRRMILIDRYREHLQDVPGITFQRITEGGTSNGVYFSIRVDQDAFGLTRDQLDIALGAENIQTRKYYMPLHWQKVYLKDGRSAKNLLATEQAARGYITLPLFSHMTECQVDSICEAIQLIYKYNESIRTKLGNSESVKREQLI